MRKLFLTLVMVLTIAAAGWAQINVPDTPVSFKFPKGGWKYLNTIPIDKNTVAYLYSYSGRYVIDSKGDTVLPHMRIYVKKNYTGSAYEMAYLRYLNQPFQSLSETVEGLPGSEGIAYIGAYNNFDDRKDYQFRMMYFKVKNTVFEFRVETTRDTFDQFDEEFKQIMESITVSGR